jgi:hypothetical protein
MKQGQIFELPNLSDLDYENIFSVYKDGDQYFYNLLATTIFPKDLDSSLYTLYEVTGVDIWPLISYKMYGSVKLWWLICSVNQIDNPVIMPPAGTKIKILTQSAVTSVLRTINIS